MGWFLKLDYHEESYSKQSGCNNTCLTRHGFMPEQNWLIYMERAIIYIILCCDRVTKVVINYSFSLVYTGLKVKYI